MKQLLLLPLSIILYIHVQGQRVSRLQSSTSIIHNAEKDTSPGRYFNVTLTNNDTVPILLKLGPKTVIGNYDTISLGITCSYTDDDDKRYDLNESSSLDDNCDCWYILELIKPKDTIYFVIKLLGFDQLDIAKLYYSYTREIPSIDQENKLNKDHDIIYFRKDKRDFDTQQILLNKHSPDNFVIEWKTFLSLRDLPRETSK